MQKIKYSCSRAGCDRKHHVNQSDVEILLHRLPVEIWDRLRAVHFNDRSRGARILGYVNSGRREIAICALPPRMSLTRFLSRGQSILQFGAVRGKQWSETAIRRFLLYDVFLHALGHIQMLNEFSSSKGLRF